MIVELLLFSMVCGITLTEIKKDVDRMEAIEKETKTLVRYGNPNQFDHAPFGAELIVIKGKNSYELFQQISRDGDNPNWVLRGQFNHNTLLSQS